MRNQSDFYDRETLYEEVWTETVSKVAERYGISNVAIAKVCKKMHIPVPGRGYWNKVNSGQKLEKLPLPEFDACPIVRRVYSNPAILDAPKVEHLVPEAFVLEEQLIRWESAPEMKITFDPGIRLTNQYVRNTEKKLKESKNSLSSYYGYGRCNSFNDETFEVSVGPDNIPRALAILQTLCDTLAKRGYTIGPKPKRPNEERHYQYGDPRKDACPIYAKILDVFIAFRITETSNRHEIEEKDRKNSYDTYAYEPSGRLCFEIITNPYLSHARNRWQDGKNIRIEDQLNDFIINMIRVVTAKKENKARAEVQRKLQRVEQEKRREQEKLERIEKARITNLVHETERMVKLNQIKEYIETISAEGKRRLGNEYPSSDFSNWVNWAESFIEKNNLQSWELPKFDLLDAHGLY